MLSDIDFERRFDLGVNRDLRRVAPNQIVDRRSILELNNRQTLAKLLKSKEFQYLKRLELKDTNEEIIRRIVDNQKQKKIARARGRGSLRKSREQNIREKMAVDRGERRERGEEEVKVRTTPQERQQLNTLENQIRNLQDLNRRQDDNFRQQLLQQQQTAATRDAALLQLFGGFAAAAGGIQRPGDVIAAADRAGRNVAELADDVIRLRRTRSETPIEESPRPPPFVPAPRSPPQAVEPLLQEVEVQEEEEEIAEDAPDTEEEEEEELGGSVISGGSAELPEEREARLAADPTEGGVQRTFAEDLRPPSPDPNIIPTDIEARPPPPPPPLARQPTEEERVRELEADIAGVETNPSPASNFLLDIAVEESPQERERKTRQFLDALTPTASREPFVDPANRPQAQEEIQAQQQGGFLKGVTSKIKRTFSRGGGGQPEAESPSVDDETTDEEEDDPVKLFDAVIPKEFAPFIPPPGSQERRDFETALEAGKIKIGMNKQQVEEAIEEISQELSGVDLESIIKRGGAVVGGVYQSPRARLSRQTQGDIDEAIDKLSKDPRGQDVRVQGEPVQRNPLAAPVANPLFEARQEDRPFPVTRPVGPQAQASLIGNLAQQEERAFGGGGSFLQPLTPGSIDISGISRSIEQTSKEELDELREEAAKLKAEIEIGREAERKPIEKVSLTDDPLSPPSLLAEAAEVGASITLSPRESSEESLVEEAAAKLTPYLQANLDFGERERIEGVAYNVPTNNKTRQRLRKEYRWAWSGDKSTPDSEQMLDFYINAVVEKRVDETAKKIKRYLDAAPAPFTAVRASPRQRITPTTTEARRLREAGEDVLVTEAPRQTPIEVVEEGPVDAPVQKLAGILDTIEVEYKEPKRKEIDTGGAVGPRLGSFLMRERKTPLDDLTSKYVLRNPSRLVVYTGEQNPEILGEREESFRDLGNGNAVLGIAPGDTSLLVGYVPSAGGIGKSKQVKHFPKLGKVKLGRRTIAGGSRTAAGEFLSVQQVSKKAVAKGKDKTIASVDQLSKIETALRKGELILEELPEEVSVSEFIARLHPLNSDEKFIGEKAAKEAKKKKKKKKQPSTSSDEDLPDF